ncbi:MAG: hypothetical protein HRT66_01455 [Flavobacteriaceae bacterium]|nr:hypothetical protein [Flavobacteriaceae bacterium]
MENKGLSKSSIVRLSLIAFVVGSIVFVAAVLPAEYGMDPLGTGRVMGFSKLHDQVKEIELSFENIKIEDLGSDKKAPSQAYLPVANKQLDIREDASIEIVVSAKKGIEYKIIALKGAKLKYEWHSKDGSFLFFDFHGEVKLEQGYSEFYESYTVANSNSMAGTFTAPFEGIHGWYFKNNSNKDITVLLQLKGEYIKK